MLAAAAIAGGGTVFKLTACRHPHHAACTSTAETEGCGPNGLIQASDGNFYGTTASGGTGGVAGTIFKITSRGTLTTLHAFDCSTAEGCRPYGLIQAT